MAREENENKKIGKGQIITGGILAAAVCAAGAALSFFGGGQAPAPQEVAVMETETAAEQVTEERSTEEVTETQETGAVAAATEVNTEEESTETETESSAEVPKYDADVKIASMSWSREAMDTQFIFDEDGGIDKEIRYNKDGSIWGEYEYVHDADGNNVLMFDPPVAWSNIGYAPEKWFNDNNDKSVEECYEFYPSDIRNKVFVDENGCYTEISPWDDKYALDEQNRMTEYSHPDEDSYNTRCSYGDGYVLVEEYAECIPGYCAQTRFELDEDGYLTMCYYDGDDYFQQIYENRSWYETHYTRNEQNLWTVKECVWKNSDGSVSDTFIEEREFDSLGRISRYESKTDNSSAIYYPVYGQDGRLEKIDKVIKTYDGEFLEAQDTYTYDEQGRVVKETVQNWSNIGETLADSVPYYLVEKEYTVSYNEKGFPEKLSKGNLIGFLVKENYNTEIQYVLDKAMPYQDNVTFITYEYE